MHGCSSRYGACCSCSWSWVPSCRAEGLQFAFKTNSEPWLAPENDQHGPADPDPIAYTGWTTAMPHPTTWGLKRYIDAAAFLIPSYSSLISRLAS